MQVFGYPRQVRYLWGSAARKPNFVVGKIALVPEQPTQGQPVKVTVRVSNNGALSGTCQLALFVNEPSPLRLLAAQTLSLAAQQRRTVTLTLKTDGLDGQRQLIALVTPVQPKEELSTADNEQAAAFFVHADYTRWRYSFNLTVNPNGIRRLDEPVTVGVDWTQAAGVPESVTLDPDSVRVLEVTKEPKEQFVPVPCAYTPTGAGNRKGKLEFLLTGKTAPNAVRTFRVVAEAQQGATRRFFPMPSELRWDATTRTVVTPFYRLRFGDDGMVREWRSLLPNAPRQSFLRSLGVSSAQTGWVDEIGDLISLECERITPVSVTVKVVKRLQGDFLVTRVFTFYPRHFVVAIEANKSGIREYSRAYYALPAQFEDDKGNKAKVDGSGGGEGVIGKKPTAKMVCCLRRNMIALVCGAVAF